MRKLPLAQLTHSHASPVFFNSQSANSKLLASSRKSMEVSTGGLSCPEKERRSQDLGFEGSIWES